MKFFHTADWHLGKLVHGVYMTEDQRIVLDQFVQAVEEEKPDAVIIAGDLYDRAIPPTEAVDLLNEVLQKIVIDLQTPVIAVAGNHDSPDRIHFGSSLMKKQGLHIVGQFQFPYEPVVLHDAYGEVHFHLVPYADPSIVRHVIKNEDIRSHDDAMRIFMNELSETMNQEARHVFVGHAFVTSSGEAEENTSDAERPLSIGGAEYVNSHYFDKFHYAALGHLHQAHFVRNETIRYSGSPLAYSISEERHKKGYYIVELDREGEMTIEKRLFAPRRQMRTVEAKIDDLLKHPTSEDYVFVKLLDENPVLQPMEKIRSVYPNAMHVERSIQRREFTEANEVTVSRHKTDDLSLLKAFYKEMKGSDLSEGKECLFLEVLQTVQEREGERG
ncbi:MULTISPECIES: exonuclease SbcCD subunit D [Bacillus cereus group]|uniref:exonuclease SbcCD subunit D n=1 Tax=Bacillus cereus group TaxID=86661 RepID=UPI0001A0AA3F|nr:MULTISPECIES: exonuclease SbcCD subunit D [Bacillus cereus group]EEL50743.1 Nuclease SbcCD, D subunit [Bacillus cereus Rock3-44]PFA22939.1 exonuclease sbcCD subunit D [Bacillus cereus]PFR24274.1 exonuclease sbcCD subunit D [Bacillus cereus]PGZ13940.1 exonuclease sbcCD subunit D [Bacillus cereus]